MSYLTYQLSGEQKRFELSQIPGAETTVGRSSTSYLVLDDVSVSGEHARFVCVEEGGLLLHRYLDLDSTNGSKLGGKPIKDALLYDGDQLSVGKMQLTYHGQARPTSAQENTYDSLEAPNSPTELEHNEKDISSPNKLFAQFGPTQKDHDMLSRSVLAFSGFSILLCLLAILYLFIKLKTN